MRIFKSILIYSLYLFLIVGCATPGTLGTKINIKNTETYDTNFDNVWEAIIQVIAEANLSITTLEKDSGIIAISNSSYEPTWADEGTRGETMGVQDQVVDRNATFNIFARSKNENQTDVQVNTRFKMQIQSGNGSQAYPFVRNWYDSYSNGSLERLIFSGIKQRL